MPDRTPLLVLVHGTGTQDHDPEDVAAQVRAHRADAAAAGSDAGEQWWQADGSFRRMLAARVRLRDGRALTEPGVVVPLKWSGANLESAREVGAGQFEDLFDDAADRRLHVIAHSHGGNVVRGGIDRLAARGCDLGRIGGVISMGTPFFTYSRWTGFGSGIAMAVVATVLLVASMGFLLLFAGERGVAAQPWWAWLFLPLLVIGAIAAAALFKAGFAALGRWWRRGRATRWRRGPRAPVRWVNQVSRTDEAIQLLKSFNERLLVFGRGKPGDAGLVWTALTGAVGMTVLGLLLMLAYTQAPGSGWAQAAALVVGIALFVPLYLGGEVARVWLGQGAARMLDRKLTTRLRRMACGDDTGAGITGVATVPWPNHPHAACTLTRELDAAIEARIAGATGALWAKLRRAIRPEGAFVDVDVRYLVDEVLTGDELSHTVYYRVDAFVELVAAELVATGDFVRVSGGATVGDRP